MNLALSADQQMIRTAAESFLGDVSTSARVREAMDSAAGHDAEVWRRIGKELGWCGITIAEEHGGLGLGPVELSLVQEQAGRRLLCSPFFATVALGANVVQNLGTPEACALLLPAIAAGALPASVPMSDSADDGLGAAAELRAHRQGNRWILDGHARRLPDVVDGSMLLVFARIDNGGTGLFAVPVGAAGVGLHALRGWDATRRFSDASFDAAIAQMRVDDEDRARTGSVRSAALARLYLAAELLGGAQQCLDLTVAYTATRKQFGRVIASFQAVKHRCAEMMVRVEALRSAVHGAAAMAAASSDDNLALECAMARALAADTAFSCAQEAIQLHGGVGFTCDYDPQLYFKRAQAASHWLGTPGALRARIAHALLA